MFTGLITDIGVIRALKRSGQGAQVTIQTAYPTAELVLGESIAVDGACLTVTQIDAQAFTVDASPETLTRTTMADRRVGDRVHLERALRLGDRLGGHVVSGHIDGVGALRQRRKQGNAWLLQVEAPPEVSPYLIEKGSIAVDGVSLTVNAVQGASFDLAIIPFTAGESKLIDYPVGQRVNLEADVLGKYVFRYLSLGRQPGQPSPTGAGGITQRMLEESGFL